MSAKVDGKPAFLTNDEAVVYTENMVDAQRLRLLRDLNRPLPSASPLQDQWMAVSMEWQLDRYTESFEVDPDIRLTLFDLGSEPGANVAAIAAGVVVAVVVVGAIAASFAIPSVRSRIYPFLHRSKESYDTSRPTGSVTTVDTNGTQASWQSANRHQVSMHNAK
jgi:hypothetical protein